MSDDVTMDDDMTTVQKQRRRDDSDDVLVRNFFFNDNGLLAEKRTQVCETLTGDDVTIRDDVTPPSWERIYTPNTISFPKIGLVESSLIIIITTHYVGELLRSQGRV